MRKREIFVGIIVLMSILLAVNTAFILSNSAIAIEPRMDGCFCLACPPMYCYCPCPPYICTCQVPWQ